MDEITAILRHIYRQASLLKLVAGCGAAFAVLQDLSTAAFFNASAASHAAATRVIVELLAALYYVNLCLGACC